MNAKHSTALRLLTAAAALLVCANPASVQAFAADEPASEQKLPVAFDLRNVDGMNFVTPVKDQDMTGTCWAFGAVAAAETDILYKNWVQNGIRPEDTALDLSELQLAWFSTHPIPADDPAGTTEPGEGVSENEDWTSTGGQDYTVASMLMSGSGLVSEEELPFQDYFGNVEWGKLNEDFSGLAKDQDGKWITETHPMNWEHDETWRPLWFRYDNEDFTVPEESRFRQDYQLLSMRYLSSPCMRDADWNYLGYDESATEAMKRELVSGHALFICYFGDDYGSGTDYMSEDYAQYTFNMESSDHAVCIVGYDDNYSRSHFTQGTAEDGTDMTPPGDGAWIVKNSWGSFDQPIAYDFGVDGSGYFYLSYYDKSIHEITVMDFDCEKQTEPQTVFQHDLLPPCDVRTISVDAPVKFGNSFVSTGYCMLDEISAFVPVDDADVSYELYRCSADTEDTAAYPGALTLLGSFEKHYENKGYYRETLPEPAAVSAGDRFLVMMTVRAAAHDGTDVYYITAPVGYSDAFIADWNEKAPEDYRYTFQNHLHRSPYDSLICSDAPGVPEAERWSDIAVYDEELSYLQENNLFYGEVFGSIQIDMPGGYLYDNFAVKAFGDDAGAPELKLSLTADKNSISAGDTVTFTLTLENTSDVFDLADVTAAGEHFSQEIGRIPAGKTETRSYTYPVSDADAAAGKLDETLTVTVGTKGSQPLVLYAKATVPAESSEPDTTTEAVTTMTEAVTTTTETEPVTAEPIASDEALCEMAVRDYQIKHIVPEVKAASEQKDGKLVITLTDADGNVRDTYAIDPVTGKGNAADGSTVDLPQTGSNAADTAAAAAAAAVLMLLGFAAVMKSGVLRRNRTDRSA